MDDLVLVIVPVFNAEKTIESSIKSIIYQTHKNIKIIAIDDCSTDNSYNILTKLSRQNKNIYITKTPHNIGCYGAINYGLFIYSFLYYDYITIHGADDTMLPQKIETQINALKSNQNKLFCSCGYRRIDEDSNEIINESHCGHSMILYTKEVFENLGYYENNRFGSDSEFIERAKAKYGSDAEINLPIILTIAKLGKNNLTKKYKPNGPERILYVKQYKNHHKIMKQQNNFYIKNIWTERQFLKQKIICGVATIKNRLSSLEDTVKSILPQVDQLIVYQNNYHAIPDFLINEKIKIESSFYTNIDAGDAGKFFYLEQNKNCIYFSIDDDLIYPNNYVETMLKYLRKYNYKNIITCHGRNLKSNAQKYTDAETFYSCLKKNKDECNVHFGGTGVMAFDTSNIKINFTNFHSKNIADIWMGLYAHEHKIPITVIPHEANWIKHSQKIDLNDTLWEKNKNNVYIDNIVQNFLSKLQK